VWLLEECSKETSYNVEVYKRLESKLAPPELKAIHPLGKSPLVTISAPSLSKPLVLAESAAICEYLSDHFAPHLIPTRYREGFEGKVGGETEQWLRYRFYMHYAEGSLMSLLTVAMFMDSKCCSPRIISSNNKPNHNSPNRHPQRPRPLLHQADHTRYRRQGRLGLPD
jgi:glutathione S-transferase